MKLSGLMNRTRPELPGLAGIARVDPVKTFIPLLKYYCLPILAMGFLIAVGVLPV